MMILICGSCARSRLCKTLGGSAAIPMDGPCVAGGSFTESKQWFYRNKAIVIAFISDASILAAAAHRQRAPMRDEAMHAHSQRGR